MFAHNPSGGSIYFNNAQMPITLPQESFEIQMINTAGIRRNVNAAVVFEIQGFVRNRNLAI